MNLWADFDNLDASTEAARARPTRRLTEQTILSSIRQWLLQDYASAYCRALAATRLYRRCYWIDAWGIDTRANSLTDNQDIQPGKSRKGGRAGPDASHPALRPIGSLTQTLGP